MNFGVPIDNNYLRTLPEYRGKSDSELTVKDRSIVAIQQKDVYVSDAVKHLDELKGQRGKGITTECRFYNASGDQIKVHLTKSWHGNFFKDPPASTVENGQWTTFIHVHTNGSAIGSTGAAVYRTSSDTDIFIGWQNPWGNPPHKPTCWTESKGKDHWWNATTEKDMLYTLDHYAGNQHEDQGYGYKINVQIGGSTTSSCVAIIEKV